MTDISKDFEALCEKEFNLARQEAFKDLDREISAIKNRLASTGNLQSSSMARAVVDAVLVRFDKVLIAFPPFDPLVLTLVALLLLAVVGESQPFRVKQRASIEF